MKTIKTIKKVKILLAVICTMVAIALCVAVCREWEAQGCDMTYSKVAGCIVYIAFSVGFYIGCAQFAEWLDYWFGNGDIYYKGKRK